MTVPQVEVEVRARLPRKLQFLLKEKWRYKGLRGGRGGAKSRTIATSLVLMGSQRTLRWLCARETQLSLKFSSRQIIVDAIERLGLQSYYRVLEDEIRGVHPDKRGRCTVFIFKGIREMSADDIKSLEDFDGIWIAEAHALSEASWNKITPTFRKEGWLCGACSNFHDGKERPECCTACGDSGQLEAHSAEIWFDYNPDFEEDFIHRWSNDPPRNAKIVHVNYDDNPWFPDVLRNDMEEMRRKDHKQYEHVWLGKAQNSVVGAVYNDEMALAYDSGRIVKEPGIGTNRTAVVDFFFDLGHGDDSAFWAAQLVNQWINLLDYYENHHKGIEHYALEIEARAKAGGYKVGTLWLPWDGVSGMVHHKMTGSNEKSPEMVLRSMGYQVRVAPQMNVTIGLSAVRSIFPQLRFNESACIEGIKHLRRYQWGPPLEDPKVKGSIRVQSEPKHDQHSHAADALRTLAVGIREEVEESDTSWKPALVQTGGRSWAG